MDLLTHKAALDSRMAACEKEAVEYEQKARALRAERMDCKAKLAEVNEQVSRLVAQQQAADAVQATRAAQAAAEKYATDVESVLASIKAKEAELAALIAAQKAAVQPEG